MFVFKCLLNNYLYYITRSNCIMNSNLTLLTYTLLFRLIVCSKRNFMTYQCVFKYLQIFNNKLIHSILSGIIKRFTCVKELGFRLSPLFCNGKNTIYECCSTQMSKFLPYLERCTAWPTFTCKHLEFRARHLQFCSTYKAWK